MLVKVVKQNLRVYIYIEINNVLININANYVKLYIFFSESRIHEGEFRHLHRVFAFTGCRGPE